MWKITLEGIFVCNVVKCEETNNKIVKLKDKCLKILTLNAP